MTSYIISPLASRDLDNIFDYFAEFSVDAGERFVDDFDKLESQFAQLESGSGVDDELAALKAKMMTGSPASQAALPPSDAAKPTVGAAIDAELEALRRQMG